MPWNCLHLFSLKAAAVGLVLTAGWQTMNGTLELPVLLMAAMFSFTIFGSVESINDAAHILSVTDSVLDRLEELDERNLLIQLRSKGLAFSIVQNALLVLCLLSAAGGVLRSSDREAQLVFGGMLVLSGLLWFLSFLVELLCGIYYERRL